MQNNHVNTFRYSVIVGLAIFAFLIQTAIGMEKIQVTATGRSVTRDLPPSAAIEKAKEDAMREALRIAGIPQIVSSTSVRIVEQKSSGKKIDYQKFFKEFAEIETSGEVIINKCVIDNQTFDNSGNIVTDVHIFATVFKYSESRDGSFIFEISGLSEVYYVGDKLSFSFTPRKDCYLRIFTFTDSTATILFPYYNQKYPHLCDDDSRLFRAKESVKFPINEGISYTGELAEGRNSEINNFLFVMLKEDIPVKNISSLEDILRWIYSIPPNMRYLRYEEILLKQRPERK